MLPNSIKNLKYILSTIEKCYGENVPIGVNLMGDRMLALQSVCIDDSDPTDVPIVLFEADYEDRKETAKEFSVYSQTGKFETQTGINNRVKNIKLTEVRPLKDNERIKKGDFLQVCSLEEYEEAGDEVTEHIEKFADKIVEVIAVSAEVNEFHENEFLVQDEEGYIVTMTSHEFNKAYREKE